MPPGQQGVTKGLQTTLDYIRHGEPVGGAGRYRGHGIDDPLSATGWTQMRTATANLTGWQRIISSPMLRCRAFAEWLAEQRNIPISLIDNLREVGFGAWEGMSREALIASQPDAYQAFHTDPVTHRPAGAESLFGFAGRIGGAFDHLASTYPGEHLLVVAHAGVIRATLGHVTQAPPINWYRTAVHNAGLSRFVVDDQGAKLIFHNWRPALQ